MSHKKNKKHNTKNGKLTLSTKPTRNYMHFDTQLNSSGTGFHEPTKYSRKKKHKEREDY